MKIVRQSWEFMSVPPREDVLRIIELAGRTCYKSEGNISPESARIFCKKILASGHHSVIEHVSATVRIITDRGVTHEIVRHRLAAYSQESTRYCNYSKDQFGSEITVILPVWFADKDLDATPDFPLHNQDLFGLWYMACRSAERFYFSLLNQGQSAQQARSVLPNSLKTELVMTCNVREWRHFFSLRCSPAAHPQMRDLAVSMLKGFKQAIPVLFDDLYTEEAA